MQLEIGTSILFLIEKRALGDAKSCSYPAMMMASGRYLSIDSVLLDDFFVLLLAHCWSAKMCLGMILVG